MSWKNRNENNTTNYHHPNESNLWELHKAMQYRSDGSPELRTNSQFTGASIDAFARLRVSNPATLFDSQQVHVESHEFTTTLTGGATKTYNANESAVTLTTGTAQGDQAVRQTTRVMPYQPGKSLLIMNTFVFNEPKAGLRQRAGYFDTQNGIYLENDGVTNYIVLRSYSTGSVVERRVAQADWNVDRFDSTGYSSNAVDRDPNAPTLNVDKTNIMWIDIEWLGVGDVRVGFVVDGVPMVAHVFHNDNRQTTVYMTTACLPLRYEITNVTVQTSSSSMKQICASVVSEGGYNLRGPIAGCGRGFTLSDAQTLVTAGTEYPLIAIRLRAGRKYSIAIPNTFKLFCPGNKSLSYRIWVGAEVTGGTWEVRPNDSCVEFNVGVTGMTVTNARLVQGGFVVNNSAESAGTGELDNLHYQLQYHADGTRPILLLSAIPTENNVGVLSKVDWIELV
jgi:hypothetical protein